MAHRVRGGAGARRRGRRRGQSHARAVGRDADAERAGRCTRRRVVGLVLRGPDDVVGGGAGLPRPHQHHGAGGHRDGRRGDRQRHGDAQRRVGARRRRRDADDRRVVVRLLGGRDRDGRRRRRGGQPGAARAVRVDPGALPEQHVLPVVLPRRDHLERRRAVGGVAEPDLDASGGRPRFHDADGARQPDQLPGDRPAAGPSARRERGLGGPGRVDGQHRRLDAHRACRGVGGADLPRRFNRPGRRAGRGGAGPAVVHPPGAGSLGRFERDRRLQSGRVARVGDGAPPSAVGATGPVEGHRGAGSHLGARDEQTDRAFPSARPIPPTSRPPAARASSSAGRSSWRRRPRRPRPAWRWR